MQYTIENDEHFLAGLPIRLRYHEIHEFILEKFCNTIYSFLLNIILDVNFGEHFVLQIVFRKKKNQRFKNQ